MPKFDREKFNTDPKHEQERADFDAMTEDALKRIAAKNKPKDPPPPEPEGFFDALFQGIFGSNLPKKD